jgi:BioD-like phosphotransacetylase family protein
MKSLYITSVERYSGKTAVCLAIGKHLQKDGFKVGYLKPLSLQPWLTAGRIADEDAAFVKEILGLSAEPWELSPVVLTKELLREHLKSDGKTDRMEQVREAFRNAAEDQDVLLLEGGGSLREGYVVGLPTPQVALDLGSEVLAIIKYRDQVRLLDDTLTANTRLGKALSGVIINRVPAEVSNFVEELAVPFIESRGIPVFGVLPEQHILAALTVNDLVDVLDAEILTKYYRPQSMVENLTVGAMTAEAALSRFRKYAHKAVITGGDRTDIQLAALETSTVCLVLTGNLHPSPLIIRQAEEFGVAVLLVRSNTMETVEKIETIYGKTRLGQTKKLEMFQSLLNENVDFERMYSIIGLK